MQQYLTLLECILTQGIEKTDRTGTGTYSIFGYEMRFNLQEGFPLITTKKVHFKSIVYELLWFLRGDTNIQFLKDHDVSIWDAWADGMDDLGPIYGKQWRRWGCADGRVIDQMAQLVEQIRMTPDSRRLLVSAWNVGELDQMRLPPCHLLFQFYVAKDALSCKLTQRSADVFLGVPFNIASYSLLTHMIAQQCHLQVGEFIWSGGDCHIYKNHIDSVHLQLSRQPRELPRLTFKRTPDSLFAYEFNDVEIINCHPYSAIKAPVAV